MLASEISVFVLQLDLEYKTGLWAFRIFSSFEGRQREREREGGRECVTSYIMNSTTHKVLYFEFQLNFSAFVAVILHIMAVKSDILLILSLSLVYITYKFYM